MKIVRALALCVSLIMIGYHVGKMRADRWYAQHAPQTAIATIVDSEGNVYTMRTKKQAFVIDNDDEQIVVYRTDRFNGKMNCTMLGATQQSVSTQ